MSTWFDVTGPAATLALSLPARPDLPRFAAFCRAADSSFLSNCNQNNRLRVFPILVINPLTVFVRYDMLSLDYLIGRLRGR